MNSDTRIVSKVLVYDGNKAALAALKKVCNSNDLIGLKSHSMNIGNILKANLDLGAIFISEQVEGDMCASEEICRHIYEARPGLPVFLRREHTSSKEGLDERTCSVVTGCYCLDELDKLQSLIDEYLFSMYYPVDFAHDVQSMSKASLCDVLKHAKVSTELPYLVKDQIIYGELFSLIPLEGAQGRGYMMLQTKQDRLLEALSGSNSPAADFKDVNAIFNELTNMIWGALRNRYFTGDHTFQNGLSQVPIIVNHMHKFISFGSTEPQLCFKYSVDIPSSNSSFTVYQRLVFNLCWSPDEFSGTDDKVEDLVENGELEFF